MKYIVKKFSPVFVLCSLFLVLTTTNCTKTDNTPQLTQVLSGEIDDLPESEFLQEPSGSADVLLMRLTWTETKFYLDGKELPVSPVKYTIEADIAGNGFASAVAIAANSDVTKEGCAANITVKDFNTTLRSTFRIAAGQTTALELRLITTYGAEKAANSVISSKILTISVAPYKSVKNFIPMYIVGDINQWNNSNTDFLMYREDNRQSNFDFTYTGKFAAGSEFKFLAEDDLGTDAFYGKGTDGKLVVSGSEPFRVETDGYYTININTKELTYSIENYDTATAAEYEVINFVGAFCGWGSDNEPDMTRRVVKVNNGTEIIDNHNWYINSIELANVEYGVKFRANHGWGDRWCPLNSTNVPYGIAEHNPIADPNISLGEDIGTYEVRFNDLIGHYFIKIKNF